MTDFEPEVRPPAAPPATTEPPTPQWLRNLTHLAGLGWATCEMAFWGGRFYPLAFTAAVLLGTAGVQALASLRRMTP